MRQTSRFNFWLILSLSCSRCLVACSNILYWCKIAEPDAWLWSSINANSVRNVAISLIKVLYKTKFDIGIQKTFRYSGVRITHQFKNFLAWWVKPNFAKFPPIFSHISPKKFCPKILVWWVIRSLIRVTTVENDFLIKKVVH